MWRPWRLLSCAPLKRPAVVREEGTWEGKRSGKSVKTDMQDEVLGLLLSGINSVTPSHVGCQATHE